MATAKKATPKSRATKGDSSVPLKTDESAVSNSPEMRKYADLPDIKPDEAEAVAIEVIRDVYVETIRFYLDRKEGKTGEGEPSTTELNSIEDLLKSFEKVIIWFDQTDKWLNDLHAGKFSK